MLTYKKFTDANQLDIHECPFCGVVCEVERGKDRPKITGWASAMSWHGTPNPYDLFQCPNNDTKWHETLLTYHEELNKTKSPRLRKLILEDISDLLTTGDSK